MSIARAYANGGRAVCDATIRRMEITPQCVVALTWTLKDSLGDTLDELEEPVEFLVGSDDLLPAISGALQGHERGALLDLNLVFIHLVQLNPTMGFHGRQYWCQILLRMRQVHLIQDGDIWLFRIVHRTQQ